MLTIKTIFFIIIVFFQLFLETVNMLLVIVFGAFLITPSVTSMSYPVFGTKRYHRSMNTRSLAAPMYNAQYQQPQQQQHQQQFYDEAPAYIDPSYGSYQQPDDSYYYLPPRRESQYYGLPTYRGEYKPKPYYYAHGPSYSYYDDRNEQANNPLDDLHEEMLQEDERERQREAPPVAPQETWYNNERGGEDKLTNDFLKNLIMYNKEMAVKGTEYEPIQQANDYEDYEDPNVAAAIEYYEPQKEYAPVINKHQRHQDQYTGGFDTRTYVPASSIHHTAEALDETTDKDVEELKNLARKNNKNNNKQSNKQNRQKNNKQNNKQKNKQQKQNDLRIAQEQRELLLQQQLQEQERQQEEHERQQYQRQQLLLQQQQQALSGPSYSDYQQDPSTDYESDPPEYDDSWINWDKKRGYYLKQVPDKYIAYSQRKGYAAEETKEAKDQGTTTMHPLPSKKSENTVSYNDGQKEVVLPRPATPVRHPFSAPVLEMLTHNSIHNQENDKRSPTTTTTTDDDDKSTASSDSKKTTVYDTIKQLLAMEQNLNVSKNQNY